MTKTVIVDNGVEEEVGGLPATGGNGDVTGWLIGGSLLLLVVGGLAVWGLRKS